MEKLVDSTNVSTWSAAVLSKIMHVVRLFLRMALVMLPTESGAVLEIFTKVFDPTSALSLRQIYEKPRPIGEVREAG